jgi:hypothetical protein
MKIGSADITVNLTIAGRPVGGETAGPIDLEGLAAIAAWP